MSLGEDQSRNWHVNKAANIRARNQQAQSHSATDRYEILYGLGIFARVPCVLFKRKSRVKRPDQDVDQSFTATLREITNLLLNCRPISRKNYHFSQLFRFVSAQLLNYFEYT